MNYYITIERTKFKSLKLNSPEWFGVTIKVDEEITDQLLYLPLDETELHYGDDKELLRKIYQYAGNEQIKEVMENARIFGLDLDGQFYSSETIEEIFETVKTELRFATAPHLPPST